MGRVQDTLRAIGRLLREGPSSLPRADDSVDTSTKVKYALVTITAVVVVLALIYVPVYVRNVEKEKARDISEPGVVERALAAISAEAKTETFEQVHISPGSVVGLADDGAYTKLYRWVGGSEVRVDQVSPVSRDVRRFRLSEVDFSGVARAWPDGLPRGTSIVVARAEDGSLTFMYFVGGGPTKEPLNPDFTRK